MNMNQVSNLEFLVEQAAAIRTKIEVFNDEFDSESEEHEELMRAWRMADNLKDYLASLVDKYDTDGIDEALEELASKEIEFQER